MNRVLRAFCGLVGLWLGLAGQAWAEDVERWLVRMEHAMASISYRGTLVSMSNGRMDTLRVVHRVGEAGVRERIYALDGPPRELLRDHDQIRCLISGQSSMVVENPFPTRLFPGISREGLVGPESVYQLRLQGTDRVAGRAARVIEIVPRDRYRYGRRLWLDRDTGMLLRSMVFTPEGAIVEKLSFVEIELGASIADGELESDLENPARVARYEVTGGAAGELSAGKTPRWLPENLPDGFRLVSVGRGDGNSEDYEHLLFSDGLASFSVYVEPIGGTSIVEQIEARGAMHIYTGTLDNQRVTVVGEVPAPTVRQIGRQLRRLQAPSEQSRD